MLNTNTMPLLEEYERQVLSMILGDKNDNQEYIVKALKPEMFINKTHKFVFQIIESFVNSGKVATKLNVSEVAKSEELSMYINSLYEEYITNVNYKYYVDKIHEAYLNRLTEAAKTVEDLEKVQREKDFCTDTSVLVPLSKGAEMLIVEEYYKNMGTAVKTGYKCLDNRIGSFQGGDLIILGGATSMGKTCMMLNLVIKMAEQNYKIDIFSLEMGISQLQNRIISAMSEINANKFRMFNMTPEEQHKYQDYAEKLNNYNINVCTEYNLDIDKFRKICKKSDANIVFVDYLGLINCKRGSTRYEKISEVSRSLKTIATEINKPLFVLHQLSRLKDDRKDKHPKLSDLRDSGNIEQDADYVCFVHRPAYYEPDTYNQAIMEFIIAKNRHGAINQICTMRFNPETQKVSEYA